MKRDERQAREGKRVEADPSIAGSSMLVVTDVRRL